MRTTAKASYLFLRIAGIISLISAAAGSLCATEGQAPAVQTLSATGVSNTVGVLNGLVNPGGVDTVAWFEWGTTTNYGSQTASVGAGSGAVATGVSRALSGLVPGVVYHGRLKASNAVGDAFGGDVSFGSPVVVCKGGVVMTNECHAVFNDPGIAVPGGILTLCATFHNGAALKSDGTVAVWGQESAVKTNMPLGLGKVVALASGHAHLLALREDGTVVSWGAGGSSGRTNVPANLSNVVAVAGGEEHSLVLKGDGTVVAWGTNSEGQINVPPGLSNVVAIAGGGDHSLALKADGKVVAWGANSSGQTNVPAGLSNVVAIAAGHLHSLALKDDGTVVAWGSNGTGVTSVVNVPPGLSNVVAISSRIYHNLAVKNDGTVVAWGLNSHGQTNVPAGLSNVVAAVGGFYHSAALQSNGTVVAWGDDTVNQTNVPKNLSTLSLVTSGNLETDVPGTYSLTYLTTNALGGTGTVTRTVVVQDTLPPVLNILGNNPFTNAVNIPFVDPGVIALDACGGSFPAGTNSNVNVAVPGTYAVTYTSTDNLGHSSTNVRTVVVTAVPPRTATTLPTSGISNSVATLNAWVNPSGVDTVAWFEWGTAGNYRNETVPESLGSGVTPFAFTNQLSGLTQGILYRSCVVVSNVMGVRRANDVWFAAPQVKRRTTATLILECHTSISDSGASASNVVSIIAASGYHSLAFRSDGNLVGWGNSGGAIPAGLGNIVAIAGGFYHDLALKTNGVAVAWGSNGYGQGTIPTGWNSNIVAIAAGAEHSLLLRSNGMMIAWGNNIYGQTNYPKNVSNIVAIAAGGSNSLALKEDGTLVAWGLNNYGQTNIPAGLGKIKRMAVGDGYNLVLKDEGTVVAWGRNTYGQTNVPAGLSNVVAVAAGKFHNLALKEDGMVVAWGYNMYGQTNVPAELNEVVAIAAGDYHSLALKNDGTVVAWGYNGSGQTNIPADWGALNVTSNATVNINSPGSYVRTYSSINSQGATGTVTRTMVVRDTLPPGLTVSGKNPLTNFANTIFLDPGATSSDLCAGTLPVSVSSNLNMAVPGTYTVTYTATDSSGNSTNKTRTVQVLALPPFAATGSTWLTNGTFFGRFTNVPGARFTVLAGTNPALPMEAWANLGPAAEVPTNSGQFQFTDPQAANHSNRFYRVRSP